MTKRAAGLALATLLAVACHRPPATASAAAAPVPQVRASCHFTAEATYDSLALSGGVLQVTAFEDREGRCAQWVASMPCWRPEDLRTREVRPSGPALARFAREVEESGFLDLPPLVGGDPGEMGRYYAYRLEASSGTRSNAVTYRSFPGGEEMPAAFERVWNALHELASAQAPE